MCRHCQRIDVSSHEASARAMSLAQFSTFVCTVVASGTRVGVLAADTDADVGAVMWAEARSGDDTPELTSAALSILMTLSRLSHRRLIAW
jgi:hypothetical protein